MNSIPKLNFPEVTSGSLHELHNVIKGPPPARDCAKKPTTQRGAIPEHLSEFHSFASWISENNEVIENLNLVVHDLAVLPVKRHVLHGPIDIRLRFLVRTFFYEFYRFRELLNDYLKQLRRRKLLALSEVEEVKHEFNEAFDGIFALRNLLVHRTVKWNGYEHCCLSIKRRILESAETDDSKFEAEFMLEHAVNTLSEKYVTTFTDQGKFIVELLQVFVDEVAVDIVTANQRVHGCEAL